MLDFTDEVIQSSGKGVRMSGQEHSHIEFYICDTCPNQPICKEGRACRYYRGWIGGHKPDINVSDYMRHPDRIPGLTKSEQKHARKLFIPKESILEEIFAEAD